jgi:peptide/nickel transport system substrate-binding protein
MYQILAFQEKKNEEERMTARKTGFGVFLLFLLIGGLLFAGGGQEAGETATASAAPKMLTYILAAEPKSMDPAIASDDLSRLPITAVYSRLVELSPDGQTLIPDLAEKWEASADGLTFTLQLRKGVKFHSGTPFNAEAARFSLERMLTLGKGQSGYLKPFLEPGNVKAVGEYTLQLKLTKPCGYLMKLLAVQDIGSMVNPQLVKEHATTDDPWAEKYLANHMDGTGPFKFIEWQPKQFVVVERNGNYYKGPAKLERITFKLVEEPATMRLMIEAGEADVIHTLQTDMIMALQKNPDVNIIETPGLTCTYLAFNNQTPPFDDVRVRQALSYAVDYEQLMKYIVKSSGMRMQGPLPKGMPAFDPTVKLYNRDLDKAKALLREAGYPNGFETQLCHLVWADIPDMALVIQSNWADVGVKAEIRELAMNAHVQGVVDGTSPTFFWTSTPRYLDASAIMIPKFLTENIAMGAAGNVSRYSNPEIDRLLKKALETTSDKDRIEIYKKVQQITTDEATWIFILQSVLQQPVHKRVKGYELPVIGSPDFWPVDVGG